MKVAFKEWAAVVDALGSGQQILLLRKGGISEGRRGFQVEHAEFLLFPTWFHQERDALLPSAHARYDELALLPRDPAKVAVEFFAHVISWRRLAALATAERLRGQHILTDEVIAKRFDWGKERNILALAVRVFRLPQAVEVPVLAEYGGCKSWIDLEQEIATDGATPVLSKEAFNEKLTRFHAALDAEAAEGQSLAPG